MKIRDVEFSFDYEDNTSMYENIILDYIDSLEENEVFYDLGACLGYFSVYANKKNLDVYSFEAEPKNYQAMVQNIIKSNSKIHHYNLAISNGDYEFMDFYVGQDYIGGHHKTIVTENFSASEEILNKNYKKIKVPSYSLDQIIKKNNLPKPKNIKVDIDGSEYDFLIGSTDSLKYMDSMIIELYKKSVFYEKIMSLMTKNGFSIYKEQPIIQPGCKGCDELYNVWFKK